MPLVKIHLAGREHSGKGRAIGDAVHTALIESLGVPPDDHFQIISCSGGELIYDPDYLDVDRSDGFLIIQIFLGRGRTDEQKKALYSRIAELLHAECQVRPQDVFVNLVEVGAADFSFGDGVAQYADVWPAHLPRISDAV